MDSFRADFVLYWIIRIESFRASLGFRYHDLRDLVVGYDVTGVIWVKGASALGFDRARA